MSLEVSYLSPKFWARKLKNKIKQKLERFSVLNNPIGSRLNVKYNEHSQYIKCNWRFTNQTIQEISKNSIYCLCIRIYDITNISLLGCKTTCIMKEVIVNKNALELSLPSPVNNGKLLIEIGYRTVDGVWNELCSTNLNLSERVIPEGLVDDSWFYLSTSSTILPRSLHERIYQLSKSVAFGGSENIHKGGSEKIQLRNIKQ